MTETATAQEALWIVGDAAFVAAVRPFVERELEAAPVLAPLAVTEDASAAVKAATADGALAIVIDAAVPGLGAAQLLRLVRALEPRRYVPVLVVARGIDRAGLHALFRLGADDVLALAESATVDGDELSARLARCLAMRNRIAVLADEAAKLQQLSVTDGLTQLFNHRFFQDRLREEFRRAQRYDDPLALVVLDLDHFKEINDRFGHPVGDQVLREVGAVLRRSVRETDIVCRYGGEEFCAILPKTHMAGSITVAERIWHELGAARVGPGLKVTASVGLSGFPGRGVSTPEQLFRTADEALYRAKSAGRNRIALHLQSGGAEAKAS